MKKNILLISFLIAFSSNATHIAGGYIYWDCASNGNYIFTLVIYRDCSGIPMPSNSQTLNVNSSSIPGITCNLVSQVDLGSSCYDPLLASNCTNVGNGTVFGSAYEKNVYKSAPITLSGTPPPNGWEFSWSTCCRSNVQQNISGSSQIFLRSRMYQNPSGGCAYDAPKFMEGPFVDLTNSKSHSSMAVTSTVGDSLSYGFASPRISTSNPVTWLAGYSKNAPFPDSTENPLNGPVAIDQNSGMITYDVSTATTGGYTYAVRAESWVNGALQSVVFRDAFALHGNVSTTNSTPVLYIDSTTVSHSNSSNSPFLYKVMANPGDVINLDFISQDFDFNSNGSPQVISFNAVGDILDSAWNPFPNLMSTAVLTPGGSQLGFSNVSQNNIHFSWSVPLAMKGKTTSFTIEFSDDHCPVPASNQAVITICVSGVGGITQDSVKICQGDSVQLTGITVSANHLWSPANGVSNTGLASPWFSPSSSQYYYLTDPNDSSLVDSVYIAVDAPSNFNIYELNGKIFTSGTANLDLHQWYYNGVPFNYPLDSLTPFASGFYWIEGFNGACGYYSDTLFVQLVPLNGTCRCW